MNNSYPFPSRNQQNSDHDCYYVEPAKTDFNEIEKMFNRKISETAISLKLQYFSIEKELLDSFHFVSPTAQNLQTSSVKFATIIREASTLYEQISRIIYECFFTGYGNINIFNYLSLEKYLKLNDIVLVSPILEEVAKNTNILKPFISVSNWNQGSKVQNNHIPGWWTGYNKLKHSPADIPNFATLENAIQSLLASYLIITSYLGSGVVSGYLMKPEKDDKNQILHRQLSIKQSELFLDSSNALGFVY